MSEVLDFLKTKSSVQMNANVVAEWNYNVFTERRTCGIIENKNDTGFLAALPSSSILTLNSTNTSTNSSPKPIQYPFEKSFAVVSPSNNPINPTLFKSKVIATALVSGDKAYRISFYVKSPEENLKVTLVMSQYNSDTNLKYSESKAFESNSLTYTKHEFLYWANATSVNKVVIALHAEYENSSILFSNFSMVPTTLYEYRTQEAFRLTEIFEGWRPGEQKAHLDLTTKTHHSLFYASDPEIPSGLSQGAMAVNNSGDRIYAPSYKRGSYYTDVMLAAPGTTLPTTGQPSRGVYAIYDEPMQMNKIVFKALNGKSYMKVDNGRKLGSTPNPAPARYFGNYISSYEFFLLEKENNVFVWKKYEDPGQPFAQNGSLILYWNGTQWTRTASHSQLSDSSLSNTKTIYGISVNVTGMKVYISDNENGNLISDAVVKTTSPVDINLRILEVSPRLTINMSPYLQSFSISNDTDAGEYYVPVGLASSNNASMVFENMPRILNGKIVPIFSDNQGDSPLSGKLNKNIKFTITYDLKDELGNTIKDAANNIVGSNLPLSVLFSDTWKTDEDGTVTVNAFDYAKYLQTQKTTYFMHIMNSTLTNNKGSRSSSKLGRIISDWLIANNFTDFQISESISNVTVESFFSDPQNTIWEVLQELLLAYQITGYFDNNGILQFDNYLDPDDKKSKEEPIFKFTDVLLDQYVPNIIGLSLEQKAQPSSIKIIYRTTAPKVNTDEEDGDIQKISFVSTRVPEILYEAQPYEGLGVATLKTTITDTDREIRLNTDNWNSGQFIWPEYSGYAVMGTEIIKYDGVIHTYSLINSIDGLKSTSAGKVTFRTVYDHNLSKGDNVRVTNLDYAIINNVQRDVKNLNKIYNIISIQSEKEFTVEATNQYLTGIFAPTIFGSISCSQRKPIKNRSELANLVASISEAQAAQNLDTSFIIQNTGKLTNVERGMFGTRAQFHGVADDKNFRADLPPEMMVKAYNGSLNNADLKGNSSILSPYKNKDKDIFLNLNGNDPQRTILYFNKSDSNLFTNYKFSFTLKEDSKNPVTGAADDVVGIVIGFKDQTFGNSRADGLYIEFAADSNKNVKSSIFQIKNGVILDKKQSNFKLDILYEKKTYKKKEGKAEGGEGKKKLIDVKRTWQKHQLVMVSFNKDGEVGVSVNGTNLNYGSGNNRSEIYKVSSLTRNNAAIGMYAAKNTNLLINSLSGYTKNNFIVAPDMGITQNLSPILMNGKYGTKPLPFYYSANPYVHGMGILEVQLDKGPAFNIKVFKPNGSYKIKNKDDDTKMVLYKVSSLDTVASYPIQGAYTSKIIIINVGDQVIPFKSDQNFSPLMFSGDILMQSGEKFVQQDLPKNTGADVLEISSDWIQSEPSANRILNKLYSQIENSSITYNLEVFGNPAIKIGDIVSLNYSLGNITSSTAKYYVIGVNHNYDGGLETSINLRRITT